MLWTILVILLIFWLLGGLPQIGGYGHGFGGGGIHLIWIVIIILLIWGLSGSRF